MSAIVVTIFLFISIFLVTIESKRVCKACVNSKPRYQSAQVSRRLYYGKSAVVNQFQSMVFVGTIDEGLREVCGGTCTFLSLLIISCFKKHNFFLVLVISLTAVLTAAHCLVKKDTAKTLRDEIVIYAGEICMNDFEDAPNPKITRVFIHPQYNKLKSRNADIAIIRLERLLETSDAIQPASLPVNAPAANQVITLPGWGYTEWGQLSNELRFIYMVVVVGNECKDILARNKVRAGICAKEGKSMPCFGDSGGPMFIMDTNTIVGITSFVFAETRYKNCTPNKPVVGTSVIDYIDWITKYGFFDH